MALFGRKSPQERIAAALERLVQLYSIDLSSRGLFLEDDDQEGEILNDNLTPRDQFDAAVRAKEYEDDEQRRAHEAVLRELEREAVRLFTPSGFVPGPGPEGAEDPASPPEDNGAGGEGPASTSEGPGSSPEPQG